MEILLELKKIVDPISLFKKWSSEAEEKEIREGLVPHLPCQEALGPGQEPQGAALAN